MILDKEEHRAALLELINHATFSGSNVDLVYELKRSILSAAVSPDVRDRGSRPSTGHDAGGNKNSVSP